MPSSWSGQVRSYELKEVDDFERCLTKLIPELKNWEKFLRTAVGSSLDRSRTKGGASTVFGKSLDCKKYDSRRNVGVVMGVDSRTPATSWSPNIQILFGLAISSTTLRKADNRSSS